MMKINLGNVMQVIAGSASIDTSVRTQYGRITSDLLVSEAVQ